MGVAVGGGVLVGRPGVGIVSVGVAPGLPPQAANMPAAKMMVTQIFLIPVNLPT
jgi:predicted cobalt transporter CbtA